MSGPLNGIRVIDVSERSPASMLAGMVLSDLGAEVIRIEPEGGDPVRALDGTSVWLRGQKSVVVDEAAVASGAWERLRSSAQVIIDTAQPWTDKPASLLADWREDTGQVLAILTATPQSPFDAFNRPRATQQAAYGEWVEAQFDLMAMQPGYHAGPTYLGWPMAVHGGAMLLVSSILAALHYRNQTGLGQLVTCSLLEGALSMSLGQWWGDAPADKTPTVPPRASPSLSLLTCADGRAIFVFLLTRATLDKVMGLLGVKIDIDPKASILALSKDPDQYMPLWQALQAAARARTADEWCEAFHAIDIPCVVAGSPGRALELDQVVANELVEIEPDGRRSFGKLAQFRGTPLELNTTVPSPGQDQAMLHDQPAQVLQDRVAETSPLSSGGPLAGLVVLDLGAFIAGPYSSRLYADLGARVIKVEELTGEKMRHAGGVFYPFHPSNRGKDGIAIDLKSEEGRRIVHDLVRGADIVHHNVREQALVKLGIDYDTLRTINPSLIYCHSTGFGNRGPWAKHPSFEYLQSALAGMLHRTGGEGNAPALYLGNMDWGQGLLGAAMVLAAVQARHLTGEGQHIEVPHTAAALLAMSDVHLNNGIVSETYPLDGQQRGHAPTNALYETADGWILVSCYSDREWTALRRALALDETNWPSYAEARGQPIEGSSSAAMLATAFKTISTLESERLLTEAGVVHAAPAVFSRSRVATDPGLRDLGVVVREKLANQGTFWELGNLQRFSRSSRLQPRSGPVLGEHTVSILTELGRAPDEIQSLVDRGVVVAQS